MGGKVSIPAEALVIMSSNPSNNESERVAWMSISTGRLRLSAQCNPLMESGEDLLKTVDKERAADDASNSSTALSGASRLNGVMIDKICDSFELEFNLLTLISTMAMKIRYKDLNTLFQCSWNL